MGKKQNLVLLFAASFISNTAIASATFNIVPKPGTSLPTTVVQGSSVSAYYLITNNTSATRAGYSIKGLPAAVVAQNTGNGYCPAVISLAPKGSCVLQLDITGAVASNFALCRGVACTSSAIPLNVSVIPAPPPPPPPAPPPFFVAAGQYDTGSAVGALIVYSSIAGTTWAYPLASLASFPPNTYLYGASCVGSFCVVGGESSAPFLATSSTSGQSWTAVNFSALPVDYSSSGYFNAVACADSFCIAGGGYSTGSMNVPFIGTSTGLSASWSSTYTSAQMPSDLNFGYFNNVSCGNTACIAVGIYSFASANYPLIVTGTNKGTQWANSLPGNSSLPADFLTLNNFNGAAASGSHFVASGSYLPTSGDIKPLVMSSSNNGATWGASLSSISPTPPAGFLSGQINGVSCSGSVCVAVGTFTSSAAYPLAATSSNAGQTWSYTITAATPQLPADFFPGDNSYFSGVSCSGTICIAVGSYLKDSANSFPLLAASSNGGQSWTYRVNSTYPLLTGDTMENGYFNTASCKGTYCMAAGTYTSTSGTSYPLVAVSSDGGVTWVYKVDAVFPALPADYSYGGVFHEHASAAGSAAFLPGTLKLLLNNR
ncbi:sialidase family protein [Legionella lytica]|uniref:Sialidase family protein n=1 Tax=Legionella lytica TaxID=96232 RepID=A0ABW8DAW6_9GAMM